MGEQRSELPRDALELSASGAPHGGERRILRKHDFHRRTERCGRCEIRVDCRKYQALELADAPRARGGRQRLEFRVTPMISRELQQMRQLLVKQRGRFIERKPQQPQREFILRLPFRDLGAQQRGARKRRNLAARLA
jgi:hypothetical protein